MTLPALRVMGVWGPDDAHAGAEFVICLVGPLDSLGDALEVGLEDYSLAELRRISGLWIEQWQSPGRWVPLRAVPLRRWKLAALNRERHREGG